MFHHVSLTTFVRGILLTKGLVHALGPPNQRTESTGLSGLDSSTSAARKKNQTQYWVDLPIDHFADCSDTYRNRYWVADGYYKPGGPIFINDIGEANAGKLRTDLFPYLEEFGGMMITWEHRYYGASAPHGHPRNHTWLTVEQALADLPAMAANFSLPNWPDVDLTPASTPWIFVGGSYPGMRAAWSREKYPNTFYAAWAASAPVQTAAAPAVYFLPIMQGLKDRGHPGCLADIQAGTKRIDEILDQGGQASKALKKRFFPREGANMTNEQFAISLTDPLFTWQYDMDRWTIRDYCTAVETDPDNDNATAPDSGWAPIKGPDWVINRMSKANVWTPWSKILWINPDLVKGETKAWMWQQCTQIGFFQVADPILDHFVSKYNNLAFRKKICREVFPELRDRPEDEWPAVHALNAELGGRQPRPSNTFWTTDQYDPWRPLQLMSGLQNVPAVHPTLDIPACNAELPHDQVFGYLLLNDTHVGEFYGTKQAKMVRRVWVNAVKAWLPCFRKKSKEEITPYIPPKCPCPEDGNKAKGFH